MKENIVGDIAYNESTEYIITCGNMYQGFKKYAKALQ